MFKKQHPAVGASPGTLVIKKQNGGVKIRLVQYTQESVQETEVDSTETLEQMIDPHKVNWIDVQGLGDVRTLMELGRIFQLHPLTLEDVVNTPQRPKLEENDGYQLVVFRSVEVDEDGKIELPQVSLIIGNHFVISFQEQSSCLLDVVRQRANRPHSRVRQNQADYLAYVILDTLVDGFYPAMERLSDQVESLEDEVIDSPAPPLLKRLNSKKNQLVNLRRVVWPLREVVQEMIRGDNDCFSDGVRLYLRDTYDHCVQIVDVIEMYREMVAGLLNTYLSAVGQRTNDVMKLLTIMSSIFIPLTFIAGIYGMNFEYMPELQFKWAYPMVWGAMGFTVVGMLIFFQMQGWLHDLFSFGKRRKTPATRIPQKAVPQASSANDTLQQDPNRHVTYQLPQELRRAS